MSERKCGKRNESRQVNRALAHKESVLHISVLAEKATEQIATIAAQH
jgi:hypothetical protein